MDSDESEEERPAGSGSEEELPDIETRYPARLLQAPTPPSSASKAVFT
jgi:hypothetical protein